MILKINNIINGQIADSKEISLESDTVSYNINTPIDMIIHIAEFREI